MGGRDTRPRCPDCGGLAAYSTQYSRCLKGAGCVVLRQGNWSYQAPPETRA